VYRKVLAAGITTAAIVGAGGTALALSGSDGSNGAPATSAPAAGAGHGRGAGRLLKRVVHGEIVTRGKNGFVTHDLIRGTVTDVSSTSITVLAADHTSETFVVNSATKVRLRAAGQGSPSSIDKVAKGDTVFVVGVGASHPTAKRVVDVKK
jgi:hypothetical protein